MAFVLPPVAMDVVAIVVATLVYIQLISNHTIICLGSTALCALTWPKTTATTTTTTTKATTGAPSPRRGGFGYRGFVKAADEVTVHVDTKKSLKKVTPPASPSANAPIHPKPTSTTPSASLLQSYTPPRPKTPEAKSSPAPSIPQAATPMQSVEKDGDASFSGEVEVEQEQTTTNDTNNVAPPAEDSPVDQPGGDAVLVESDCLSPTDIDVNVPSAADVSSPTVSPAAGVQTRSAVKSRRSRKD